MKKKAVIISVVAVAVIALITVAILVLSKEKQNPEEILKTYFAYIEKQNYEEMYNMVHSNTDKEEFLKRNKNIYEGIQERQDACIKVNVLNNTNIWVQFNSKSKKKIEKLIKTGLVNKYGIPLSFEEMSQEQWKLFTKIIKNEEGEKIE